MPTFDTEMTSAIVDSTEIAQMIAFIDHEFSIDVSKHEVSVENLGSLRAVARFVASKQPLGLA
jgi:acyl carrier protein